MLVKHKSVRYFVGFAFAGLLSFGVLVAGVSTPAVQAAEGNVSDLVNRSVLRVCADPANLPFSGKKTPGFENKIADIVADELKVPVEYTWFPQATGFIRRTLYAKRCDLVVGYAQGDEFVLNTNHYYSSTYALVYRNGQGLDGLNALGDPRLKGKKIGIIAGTPPATIMAQLGLIANARPYQLTVDRRHFSPAEEMTKDLRAGDIDVGILWGPIAGYYGTRGGEKLTVVPLVNEKAGPRMSYRITMGVRQSDANWKRQLNEIIVKRQNDINKVLLEFGVPILDEDNKPIVNSGAN